MAIVKDVVLSCLSKSKILKWHVKLGDLVKKDKVLATYIFTEKVESSTNFITQRKLKAKFNGKVVEVPVKPNEEISKGQIVARIEESDQCEHETIMKEMCCDCGADLRKEAGVPGDLNEPAIATVPVVHNILELKVSMKEAERLAKYDEQQLLRARKLVLVVDLDMTLIHTTVEPVPKDSKDVYSFTLPGHQYEYHTKLRPGAKKFLQSISKFYELHIFTMGSRMYAHTVAKCLDPDGKFFAHRIRSRDEFINSFSKFHDLKALFPCGDHMVCIIDDREDVWHYAPNLINVKPYKYFKNAEDINDPFKLENVDKEEKKELKTNTEAENKSEVIVVDDTEMTKEETAKEDPTSAKSEDESKPSVDEISKNIEDENASKNSDNKENTKKTNEILTKNDVQKSEIEKKIVTPPPSGPIDLDDYLFYLDEILEKIHFSFYSTLDGVKAKGGSGVSDSEITKFCTMKTLNPDVRVIVPELKRQTLKGCNLVFTGVIPTNIPLEKSKAYKTAINLGARVDKDIVGKSSKKELATTHVVAARHGTHKAHKAFRNPDIFLVNPNWLWCAGDRWEAPIESLYPVPLNGDKSSPKSSRQGTPQHSSNDGKSKKISPLAQGFEIPGGYNPDHFLDSVNPLTFSKEELDDMDKEVEELMLSANDDNNSSEDDKFSKTTDRDSKTSISSTDSSRKRGATSDINEDHLAKKLKKKLLKTAHKLLNKTNDPDEENDVSVSSDSGSESDSDSSSSSSSSDSDDNSSNDDGEEDQLASLLENDDAES